MILALALSPSVDVAYEVERVHHGGVTRPTATVRVPGGKALNAARVAASLGAEVHVVAPLGGSTGAWIADRLAAEGIPVTAVPVAGETRTCIAITERAAGSATSTDLYEPATAVTADEWRELRRAALAIRGAARGGDRLLLSGSIPPGVPLDNLAALLDELRGTVMRVAVDGSGPGLRATAGSADLLKLNRAEAADLLRTGLPDARAGAEALREVYGVDAIVTDGIRGGAAATGRGTVLLPQPVGRGRYPAGSGDAFLGGLLAALERGADLADALERARDAAERNARALGQGLLASSS